MDEACKRPVIPNYGRASHYYTLPLKNGIKKAYTRLVTPRYGRVSHRYSHREKWHKTGLYASPFPNSIIVNTS